MPFDQSARLHPSSGAPSRAVQMLLAPVLLALALHVGALPARAQIDRAVPLFDEGNARYAAGDYRGAVDHYERAAASGYVSGALFYNMGNAYYRLDEVGQAIRFYEKARRLLPDDAQLLHNLEMARARTVDEFSRLPEPFWRPWWRRLVRAVGVGGLFTVGLLFHVAAAGLAALRIWRGRRAPWLRRALWAAALLGVTLLTSAYVASAEQPGRRAVVVAEQSSLRTDPLAGSAVERDVHEGALLDVLDERDGWLRVRLPNGATGWIEGRATASI